jgi:hypothetical protein
MKRLMEKTVFSEVDSDDLGHTSTASGWVSMNAPAMPTPITPAPNAPTSPATTARPMMSSQMTDPRKPMITPSVASTRGGRPSAAKHRIMPNRATIPVGMNRPITARRKPNSAKPLKRDSV